MSGVRLRRRTGSSRRGGPGAAIATGALFMALTATSSSIAAQEAELVYPVDVITHEGRTIVADFKAFGLLEIHGDGSISSVYQGEGRPRTPLYGSRAVLAAPDGDGWLVADPGTFGLYRVASDGSLATITTELDIPQGLARFDDDSVLVSDLRSGIGAVMKVTLDGIVTVFAEINSPKGIVPDGDEGFVVVSHGDRAVYRLGRDGQVSVLHRGPPLDFPHDLVRRADGSFVVTDGYASALFAVSPEGAIAPFVRGTPLVNPQGIAAYDDETLVVVDPQAGAVFRIDSEGSVERWVGPGS